jgi:ISXO2-like transposase domain
VPWRQKGAGAENKVPFVAAVSLNGAGHPIAMNMNVVKGFRLTEISCSAKRHLQAGSTVISDVLACFSAVKDPVCSHVSILTGDGEHSVTKEEFTLVNTTIGNAEKAISGTYHAINPKHLPRYLAEFC